MSNGKIIGILLSLTVLAIIILPTYAAGNSTALNMTGNASVNMTPVNASMNKTTVNLVAKDLAFSTSTITVPAGANVTINFDNQNSGVPHNFAVYETSAAQKVIFKGPTITGPDKTTYTFTAPSEPGTYFFRCDTHFTKMTGQFIVK